MKTDYIPMNETLRELMNPPTPSELIRCARESRHLSIREMAAALGCSSRAVTEWESGAPVPPWAMRRLMEFIEV